MADMMRQVAVTRVRGADRSSATDAAATEEPLEVRLQGEPFAVIMRTPGSDLELAAGFLLSENVLRGPDDLALIEHCTDPTAEHAENIVNVSLGLERQQALPGLLADRRQVQTNSSCGLCGRRSIESLGVTCPPIDTSWRMAREVIGGMPVSLRRAQAVFEETGGLHAAALFSAAGQLESMAEDVGRHNAVDKVIGRMLLAERLPLGASVLFVSGRTSFEIVQKAWIAGVPLVASVSAPSSLAIDLAIEAGITLVGFVRGDGFNIYAHGERIV